MKFLKWCLFGSLLFFFKTSFAQSDIDLLIPYTSDTSIFALNFLEKPNGNFIILNNNQEFYAIPGQTPIEGPITYGTGFIKLSNTGDVLANTWFPTNSLAGSGGLFSQGRIPSEHFLISNDETIFLPYSIYAGLLECDEIFAKPSFKKSAALINDMNFEMIDNNHFPADNLCAVDEIRGTTQISNGNYLILYQDKHIDSLIVEEVDSNLSIISTTPVFVDSPFLFFDDYADSFITCLPNSCQFFDFNGTSQNSFDFQEPLDLSSVRLKLKTTEDHIIILVNGFTSYPERGSALTILDRQGGVVAQKAFPDEVLIDFDITINHQIILLSDNSLFDFYDSMPLPLRIQEFNLNLELLSERNYGQPFIQPQMVKCVGNNEFAVLGTRFKSIDLINGKEADQVYFLKRSMDDLIPVSNKLVTVEYSLIAISPNPASDEINISLNEPHQMDEGGFQFLDLSGKVLLEFQMAKGDLSFTLNVEKYPNGVYFLTYSKKGKAAFSEQIIVRK